MSEIYISLGVLKNTCFYLHEVSPENSEKFDSDISAGLISFCELNNVVIFEFNNKWRVISISDEVIEYSIENLEIMLPALIKAYEDKFSCIEYYYDKKGYQELICPIAPIMFLNVMEGTPRIEGILYYLTKQDRCNC